MADTKHTLPDWSVECRHLPERPTGVLVRMEHSNLKSELILDDLDGLR